MLFAKALRVRSTGAHSFLKRRGLLAHILLPVDFSKTSLRALEFADWQLENGGRGSSATLVHVIDPGLWQSMSELSGIAGPSRGQWSEIESNVREKLLKIADRHLPGRAVRIAVIRRRGSAAETIVRFAQEEDFDSITLATHGRTGLSRLLIGSVAERVLGSSTLPTCVVPCMDQTTRKRKAKRMHIVALTDLSPEKNRFFKFLRNSLSHLKGQEYTLHLVNIVEDLLVASYHLPLGCDAEEIWVEREEAARAKLDALRDRYFPGQIVLTTAIRQYDSISNTLLDFAQGHRANLIIVGKHKRKGVDKFVLGRVADRVVRYASCPVVVVPL